MAVRCHAGSLLACLLLWLLACSPPVIFAQDLDREKAQLIPILGLTKTQGSAVGAVTYLLLSFYEREDRRGLSVEFGSSPGRFSQLSRIAIEQAIRHTAQAMDLSPDGWSITLSVPYPGLTVYGESLSAMVGLSVVALAKGDAITPYHVITGFVTPDGHIGPVGGVPLKVKAAQEARMRRVLIPEEADAADGEWDRALSPQVSPVGSVRQAYRALTEPDQGAEW